MSESSSPSGGVKYLAGVKSHRRVQPRLSSAVTTAAVNGREQSRFCATNPSSAYGSTTISILRLKERLCIHQFGHNCVHADTAFKMHAAEPASGLPDKDKNVLFSSHLLSSNTKHSSCYNTVTQNIQQFGSKYNSF